MEKSLSALQAVAVIEQVDITSLNTITRESMSDIIMLMAPDGVHHPHVLHPVGPGNANITEARNQDTEMSLRIRRIRDSQA